ncbi:MAG: hypothetical protein QW087_07470 [Methanomassiliicoccales archaeon]
MTTSKFVLRKLCSGIEEYEATPHEPMKIDLAALESRIKERGIGETSLSPVFLLLLMEKNGAVCHIYSNGKILIKANLREEALEACELIYNVAEGYMNCQIDT